jgi:hypothetical protein
MAKYAVKDAVVTVNGVTLSDHASSANIEGTKDEIDVTGFTSAGYREFVDGFKNASITVDFFQDFAGSSVDQTLWPLFNTAGTTFAVEVVPASGAISATNPKYSMPASKLMSYNPLSGGVGDASTTTCTFSNAGTAGLTRGTS